MCAVVPIENSAFSRLDGLFESLVVDMIFDHHNNIEEEDERFQAGEHDLSRIKSLSWHNIKHPHSSQ